MYIDPSDPNVQREGLAIRNAILEAQGHKPDPVPDDPHAVAQDAALDALAAKVADKLLARAQGDQS